MGISYKTFRFLVLWDQEIANSWRSIYQTTPIYFLGISARIKITVIQDMEHLELQDDFTQQSTQPRPATMMPHHGFRTQGATRKTVAVVA